MQSTLRPQARCHRDRPAIAPAVAAIGAIALGVATYAFARPHAAAFLPAGWHKPLLHGSIGWILAGLPSFVHALAMPLLTAVVLGSRRQRAPLAICATWGAVELVFEAMQQPALRDVLLRTLISDVGSARGFAPFANYLRTGTFDPIDIAAALLASMAAYAILIRSQFTLPHSAQAQHVQF